MTPGERDRCIRLARLTAAAQGLPDKIEDPLVIERLAALLRPPPATPGLLRKGAA